MKAANIFLLAAALFALACAHEEPTSDEQLNEQAEQAVQLSDTELRVLHQMRGTNNRIDLEEAMQLALRAAGSPSGSNLAKSAAARRIGSVKMLRTGATSSNALTKSVGGESTALPDTVAYVFNFADNGGFAIVAADTRVESPLLAFCDYGSLGDTIDNPGLALFLEGAAYYMEKSIAESQRLRDSMLNDILEKVLAYGVTDTIYPSDNSTTKALKPIVPDCSHVKDYVSTSYGNWEILERVGPLLPVEWKQGVPFNNNVPVNGCVKYPNGKAPAGCVAIATAQLMAYWRHPSGLDGMNFDWDLLRSYTAATNRYNGVGNRSYDKDTTGVDFDRFKTQAAHLVRRIGANISMDYDCTGSGATTSDAVEFLRSKGYTYGVSGYLNENWELGVGYDYGTVVNSLNNGRPVITEGDDIKTPRKFLGITFGYSYEGHAWVVDGYLKRQRLVTVTARVTRPGSPMLPYERSVAIRGIGTQPCTTTTTTSTYYETPAYLHNNWGWGAISTYSDGNIRYNGYYLAGCFDARPGATLPSATGTSSPSLAKSSGENDNYQYNIKIFPNIYR